MNNLSSYCDLVDAKIRASDKDLSVGVFICTLTVHRIRSLELGFGERMIFLIFDILKASFINCVEKNASYERSFFVLYHLGIVT